MAEAPGSGKVYSVDEDGARRSRREGAPRAWPLRTREARPPGGEAGATPGGEAGATGLDQATLIITAVGRRVCQKRKTLRDELTPGKWTVD